MADPNNLRFSPFPNPDSCNLTDWERRGYARNRQKDKRAAKGKAVECPICKELVALSSLGRHLFTEHGLENAEELASECLHKEGATQLTEADCPICGSRMPITKLWQHLADQHCVGTQRGLLRRLGMDGKGDSSQQ